MSKKTIDEKKTAAASYILNFYQEVNQITHNYAQYLNLLLEIHNKHGKTKEDLASMEEHEKAVLMQAAQSVRYYAHKCYITYKTLIPSLKLKENTEIENLYKSVKDNYVIENSELERFIVILNTVLVEEIIQDLIDTSQSLVESIYSENEAPETKEP